MLSNETDAVCTEHYTKPVSISCWQDMITFQLAL
jgi:hypothetical protein